MAGTVRLDGFERTDVGQVSVLAYAAAAPISWMGVEEVR
jgi:hypothetical protein